MTKKMKHLEEYNDFNEILTTIIVLIINKISILGHVEA